MELTYAINEPSTYMIGVISDGDSIQTMVSGDELDLFRQTADALPALYEGRESAGQMSITVLERPDIMTGLQNIFIATMLIVAMFMGCTFNAMNIISEKENGVDLVNQVLPMTQSGYVIQKIFAESLMVGVVYIKIIMIIFMAVPLVSYLLATSGLISVICYFVPSSAAFEGIMNLANSDRTMIAKDMLILMVHCIIWFLLYLSISKWRKKHT